MYSYLRGILAARKPASAVVEAGGVGYEVQTTLLTSGALPEPGVEVLLHVHPVFREDRVTLFGFLTEDEREVFTILLTVAGVGPGLARTILSGTTIEGLAGAVLSGDEKALVSIPGVGRKLAQRLVVELREPLAGRAGAAPAGALSGPAEEAVGALVTLGYPRIKAFNAVRDALRETSGPGSPTVESLVREALRRV